MMLTAEGCRARRQRFLDQLKPSGPIVLADPVHLRYFANFHIEPFSLGADFGGILVLHTDGNAVLYHDNRLPRTVESSHVDKRITVPWYDGQTPGQGPRGLVLWEAVQSLGGRIHDSIVDPLNRQITEIVCAMRRRKDDDEIDVLKACMRVTEIGHAWARANIQPGMTELDVYAGVAQACNTAVGHWVLVYGDFVVSPGPDRRTGPPTSRILQVGETFIHDFSVILQGYRSDFTNTIVVGRNPTTEQIRLFDLCLAAMGAGERELRAGETCQLVYDSVRDVFRDAGMADHFPHHAGHGLGLCHPEAPYIVRYSTDKLVAGDVVTLEPGLYVDGIGGVRIEHNYWITESGCERLSNHVISPT